MTWIDSILTNKMVAPKSPNAFRVTRPVLAMAVALGLLACGIPRSPAPAAPQANGQGIKSDSPVTAAPSTSEAPKEASSAPAASAAVAAAPATPMVPLDRAAFQQFLEGVRNEALTKGIKADVVTQALADVEPVQRILERDRNQAEFKLTFATYRDRVITPQNVERGRRLRDQNAELLGQVAQRYGVQPRFILAIWGIETRYGAVKADQPLIPALATLAFDPRRSGYFRGELFAALQMLDRGYIDLGSLKGSWAGAMGQPQFMPSSYLAFAEDFDRDGRRDIWSNNGDVFASIANYLAKNGWNSAQTWGREVRLPAGIQPKLAELARTSKSGCRAIDQMSEELPLADWTKLGVRRSDGGELPKVALNAAMVQPDGASGPAFLVYGNYRSVLRYNCAHHYALTVSLLADRLSDG